MLAEKIHDTLTKHTLVFYAAVIVPTVGAIATVAYLALGLIRRDRASISRALVLGVLTVIFAAIDAVVAQFENVLPRLAIGLGGLVLVLLVIRHILRKADLYEETKKEMRFFGQRAAAESQEDEEETYPPAPDGEVRCQSCGEANKELATFCSQCSERL